MEIDKMLPNEQDIEKTILGAVLAIDGLFNTLPSSLTDNCFYTPKNALIWQYIVKSAKEGQKTDMLTVIRYLKKDGYLDDAGGVIYFSELTADVKYTANFKMLCDVLVENYLMRETIKQSSAIASRCAQNSASADDIRTAVKSLYDFVLTAGSTGKQITPMPVAIRNDQEQYDKRASARNNGKISGIKTGLRPLDTILGGWQNNNLIILAARPAMGKTSLSMHFARWSGVPTLYFSIEMSEEQITRRMVVTESEVNGTAYKLGSLAHHEIEQVDVARDRLRKVPIFFNDQTPISISQIRQEALKFRRDYEGEILIIVDYLQLVKHDSRTTVREQQIAEVSRGLKEISKVCDCPVIALAQLSRAVEQRGGDKKPVLSDLRESGQIEQDADMVIFIHRAEYYGLTVDAQGNSTVGKAELIVAKNRDGQVGSVEVGFIDRLTKFTDYEKPPQMQPNADFLSKNDLPF